MKPLCYSLLGCLVLTVFAGCGQYSEVSPEAYRYSQALYSVCNRHDQERLAIVSQQIDLAHGESRLTDEETAYLEGIVAVANAGDWIAAAQDARYLLEAQIQGR